MKIYFKEPNIHGTARVVAILKNPDLKLDILNLLKNDGIEILKANEMKEYVLHRTEKINSLVDRLILNKKINSIVEIGSGYSNRCETLKEKYPELKVLKTDIEKIKNGDNSYDDFFDILSENDTKKIEAILPEGKVCFVIEGVFPYFNREQMDKAIKNLNSILEKKGGYLVFDVATIKGLQEEKFGRGENSKKLLQYFYDYSGIKKEKVAFVNLHDAKKFFIDNGYDISIQDLDTYNNKSISIDKSVFEKIISSPSIFLCKKIKGKLYLEQSSLESFIKSSKGIYQTLGLNIGNLSISKENRTLNRDFELDEKVNGYEGISHGGIGGFLIDTGNLLAMPYAEEISAPSVNSEMITKFLKPLNPGRKYKLQAKMEVIDKKSSKIKAKISDDEGFDYIYGESKIVFSNKIVTSNLE